MRTRVRQRELEMLLQKIPPTPNPDPDREQYRTPAPIAADLLYRALARGDVRGRRVLDLGCGTGTFAIGALLLGAAAARGVDVDEAGLAIARRAAEALGVRPDFEKGDASEAGGEYDVVLMNPPFGAQFAARHLDSAFLEVAMRCAPVAYSLHLAATGAYLERLAARFDWDVESLVEYDFALPAQFRFHTKEREWVRVRLYRFARRE